RLVAEVERLFWRAERYNRLVLSTAARFERSVGYYTAFLAACERRDGEGADVGGTFTDVLALDADGGVRVAKVRSTPPDYDRAVVEAVRRLAGDRPEAVVHGTTVATNAVLERRGARTALVTTAGFRDVLELRRMRMPHLYDPFWRKPEPLVPRRLRLEVGERMSASGEVLRPLDEDEVRAL